MINCCGFVPIDDFGERFLRTSVSGVSPMPDSPCLEQGVAENTQESPFSQGPNGLNNYMKYDDDAVMQDDMSQMNPRTVAGQQLPEDIQRHIEEQQYLDTLAVACAKMDDLSMAGAAEAGDINPHRYF